VDGTLCRIRRPRIAHHKLFYSKRKAMYCLNSLVIVDHYSLIIYVDPGFPGSFHDIRCLKNSNIHKEWRRYFTCENLDEVGEYLLGDPAYLGADMYILRKVDLREVARHNQSPVVTAFNKRHSKRRIKVEWGIGAIKNRWRRFLDTCPNRRRTFQPVFEACCRLTNVVHRQRKDLSIVDLGEAGANEENGPGQVNEWGYDLPLEPSVV
jgi:hypothetical protein